ncbi:MAG TPA: 5'-nucleotidase C-terminal domain-containing protein [Thermoanaerobaculia bacterium]|nr:5'-nucleotidase C-terminal domain-containing protein [Thermoanaerobaculia bacterium]
MKRSLPLVLFLLASACASAPPRPAAPVHVVVVGTTDVHGWFNGHIETPPGGGAGVVWGGLPALSSYLEAIRKENEGRVVLVDSGDMFQGTLESNMFEGEAVVRGYNVLGYHAAAVGNHEFDFGPVGPDVIARKQGDDELGALKRNAGIANFPFLSANMVEKATRKTPSWAKPYTIVRSGGAKIGIIGLSTPDTPNVTMAANVISLDFTDPVAATIAAAKELRAQGVDAIVVTAHIGGRCSRSDEPHSLEACDRQQEAMRLIEALPPGTIDAFFAGHTHAQMRHYVNGVPAAQGLAYSREFSAIDLWIDTANDKVVKSDIRPLTMICSFVYEGTDQCDPRNAPANAKLVPRTFLGATMTPDTRVAATVEPFLKRVAAKRDEKLGVSATAMLKRSYSGESALGNLIADAMRETSGAEIAFMNSGGIRADLPEGELTYGDIFAVSPFDNYPAIVIMTAEQIKEMLRLTTSGNRGILQTSGIRYTIDMAKDADKDAAVRNRITEVTLPDGSPLDPQHLYTVVMPDFIAMGGDGVMELMQSIPQDRVQIFYARPIRDTMVDVLKKWNRPITPRFEGRITILNPPAR